MKFLIVEDDLAARKLLGAYLSECGECTMAVNGQEAISAVERALKADSNYDLICLDIMMPDIDGYSTLKAIRKLEKERGLKSGSKVIMTTALSEFENITNAFRTGCESYLVKPIRKDDLLEEMAKLGLTRFVKS